MSEIKVPEKDAVLGQSQFKLVIKYYLGDNTKEYETIPTCEHEEGDENYLKNSTD